MAGRAAGRRSVDEHRPLRALTGNVGRGQGDELVVGGLAPVARVVRVAETRRLTRDARLEVEVRGETVSSTLVRATWTDDEALSTRVDRRVEHFTGQVALADAIQEGLAARSAGDERAAIEHLGLAVALAAESGNETTLALLGKVVDIADAPTGQVRLRVGVTGADEMALDTGSTRTVRVRVNP